MVLQVSFGDFTPLPSNCSMCGLVIGKDMGWYGIWGSGPIPWDGMGSGCQIPSQVQWMVPISKHELSLYVRLSLPLVRAQFHTI